MREENGHYKEGLNSVGRRRRRRKLIHMLMLIPLTVALLQILSEGLVVILAQTGAGEGGSWGRTAQGSQEARVHPSLPEPD